MKNHIVLIILILIPILTFGQVMPEAFLGNAPEVPLSACIKDMDVIQEFENQVESLLESIEIELERRNEESEANSDNHEQEVMQKLAQQYGLSETELKKLQDEDTKSCLITCYRIESISALQTKLQTGVDMKAEPGLVGIKKVADYVQLLRGAYKYNLFQNR